MRFFTAALVLLAAAFSVSATIEGELLATASHDPRVAHDELERQIGSPVGFPRPSPCF